MRSKEMKKKDRGEFTRPHYVSNSTLIKVRSIATFFGWYQAKEGAKMDFLHVKKSTVNELFIHLLSQDMNNLSITK